MRSICSISGRHRADRISCTPRPSSAAVTKFWLSRNTAMIGMPIESRNRMRWAKLLVFLRVRLATTASLRSFRFTFATSNRSAIQRDAAAISIGEGNTGTRILDESRVSSLRSSCEIAAGESMISFEVSLGTRSCQLRVACIDFLYAAMP